MDEGFRQDLLNVKTPEEFLSKIDKKKAEKDAASHHHCRRAFDRCACGFPAGAAENAAVSGRVPGGWL